MAELKDMGDVELLESFVDTVASLGPHSQSVGILFREILRRMSQEDGDEG